MAREINLVPDIKEEMIKTLKLRNYIFFLCIAVAAISVGATLLVGLVMGGQKLAIDNKKATIGTLSAKLNSYTDLSDFLTIKDQLDDISTLTSNKKDLSRTFGILATLFPTGVDTIKISELTVNLEEENPTFSFDAQANAGSEPYIDYNVLDSFKKSMQYMRYDYGNYVDREGNKIPAYCMIETGPDGAVLRDEAKGIYAYWTINGEGCANEENSNNSYSTEEFEGQQVVRIWRTPQFSDWYKENKTENKPYMSLDGQISNVEHFESNCIKYTGDNATNSSSPKWTETNEECRLVPAGTDGISISESSNGRDANDELVLRFSATIVLSPEVYKFANHHMLTFPPSGRYNVTDSYIQVQAMFSQRATDCAEGDTACDSKVNQNGGE